MKRARLVGWKKTFLARARVIRFATTVEPYEDKLVDASSEQLRCDKCHSAATLAWDELS